MSERLISNVDKVKDSFNQAASITPSEFVNFVKIFVNVNVNMESSNDTDTGDTGSMNANSTVAHIPPRISMVSKIKRERNEKLFSHFVF